MPRKRVIDTGIYFDTEICKLLGPRGLHLYIRLWGLAEDWGGYEANYEDIALQMGALKFNAKEAQKYIELLISSGKIIQYSFNGKNLHWLKNFSKHQPLNNPGPPRLPLPEWINCEIKKYESGKVFAKYEVISQNIPVGYQYTTSNVKTETETETETEKKHSDFWGEFKNVSLTEEEKKKVSSEEIESLSSYLASHGKKYKSHYATILNWRRKNNPVPPAKLSVKHYCRKCNQENLKSLIWDDGCSKCLKGNK